MKRFFHRLAVIGVFGVLALLVVHTFASSRHDRFGAAKKRVTAECRAYRGAAGHENADICRFDGFRPSAMKSMKSAEERIAESRSAFARGNVSQARTLLTFAAATATDLDRRGTLLDQLVAAKVADEVLATLEAHRAELDAKGRLDVLANLHLAQAAAPFESERLQHEWSLVYAHENEAYGSEASIADAIERDDAAYRAMSRASAQGDVAGCEKASKALGKEAYGGAAEMAPFCGRVAKTVAVSARIDTELAKTLPALGLPAL